MWSVECGVRSLKFFCSDNRLCSEARSSELQSYSWTSGVSNHHRQSVSTVKNDATPTASRGRLTSVIKGAKNLYKFGSVEPRQSPFGNALRGASHDMRTIRHAMDFIPGSSAEDTKQVKHKGPSRAFVRIKEWRRRRLRTAKLSSY